MCHFAVEEVPKPPAACAGGIKLADRQIERLLKAAEKAEQARAKMEKRKREWAQLWVLYLTMSPSFLMLIKNLTTVRKYQSWINVKGLYQSQIIITKVQVYRPFNLF